MLKAYSWLGHVLRHDGLLKNIFKGKMSGKPARERKRLNKLSDLAEKEKYVALKEELKTGKSGRN